MKLALPFLPLLAVACGSTLPAPEAASHPLSAYEEVPYPPPAALAETVPRRPQVSGLVWLDGEWLFHGSTYVWHRGGWVVPPRQARYAAWQDFYRADGRLMWAPNTWYDPQHRALRAPEPVAPATTPANELTPENQTGR
jgi:hypothetical protein